MYLITSKDNIAVKCEFKIHKLCFSLIHFLDKPSTYWLSNSSSLCIDHNATPVKDIPDCRVSYATILSRLNTFNITSSTDSAINSSNRPPGCFLHSDGEHCMGSGAHYHCVKAYSLQWNNHPSGGRDMRSQQVCKTGK